MSWLVVPAEVLAVVVLASLVHVQPALPVAAEAVADAEEEEDVVVEADVEEADIWAFDPSS
jgi:hypothetical protein